MASGSDKRVRNAVLTIRLTAQERTAIDEAAQRAGLSTASYSRNTLLNAPAPRQVRRPPIERTELARLLGELGKVGSNLNQLAREANQGHDPLRQEIMAALGSLRAARDAVLAALGRGP